jgi:hypothetical protein
MDIGRFSYGDGKVLLDKERKKSGKTKRSQGDIADLYATWKIFLGESEGKPARPLTGHLQGEVDRERMMKIKEEIENREAERRGSGDFRS